MAIELVVKADHFQVLVGDGEDGPRVDTSELWESPRSIPAVSGAPELIALPVVRFGGEVQIEMEVVVRPPEESMPDWESIGRFDLHVPSGEIRLWGPELEDTAQAVRFRVPSGFYAGEAFSKGTDQVEDEQAIVGPDRYRLVLWPGARP